MGKATTQWSRLTLPAGALLATLGCASPEEDAVAEPEVEQAVAALERGVVVATVYDDSASPVHIQVRTCKSGIAASVQQVDCRVDAEFAVIGGGATPSTTNGKPFLVESRPIDGRIWRAGSKDLLAQPHDLTVYAIGMRLDGVNTEALRRSFEWKSGTTSNSSISRQVDSDALLLGGGAMTEAAVGASGHRLLTTIASSGKTTWTAASRAQAGTVAGATAVTLLQIDKKIIEGFGALELLHKSGPLRSTSGGVHATTLSVDQGWALVGMGGVAKTATGASARMITSIAPCANGRCVTATSNDQNGNSAGTTAAYIVQVRKAPGSHGLCNPGNALVPAFDGCVANICAARSSCCSSSWDSTCVDMVPTVCGRSCAEHTCVRNPYEPSRWLQPDGTAVPSNCYYYVRNKYPDGLNMDPGGSLNKDPDEFFMSRLPAFAAGDGLIPTTFDASCPGTLTKVFLSANSSSMGGYHWWRQDDSGLWSDKFATWGLAELSPDRGVGPYHNVQNNTYEAYFCACNQALPATP